ncbi:MAG: bifunctional 5,10-methylenetetrahydrofolate dehydrogenase/5,10-methenyltetrahydrofolate cyclohydrolase [Clostridia bacterium]|nr:bifunctional 5,10-methylenetetrahydrofolate dehydrogenase/5,10-methenyltetrahydrofolate cyclohydrolase [Clostridia bacterium]MBR0356454.1 bifunctional 5,10-methylenetetrahydrofolate dehydrogenase/5,10-methenyltetrahydrofolate cyclohydrolase [Clostridia bacterium]
MLLTGKQPAEQLYAEIDQRVKGASSIPGLFAVYEPDDVPAGWYLRSIQRASEAHGIPFYAHPLSEGWDLPPYELGGMIVLSKTKLPVTIPEELDVDGRDPNSHHTLYVGGLTSFPRNTPCTAESCVRLLEYYGIPISGRHAVILSRSMTVGRPLAMLLIDRDATVTICHSKTQKLPELCRQADILVCATGKAGLIGKDCVRPGQTVINVGGDVVEEEVPPIVENYAPFKGGVGALTTAILLKHVTDKI